MFDKTGEKIWYHVGNMLAEKFSGSYIKLLPICMTIFRPNSVSFCCCFVQNYTLISCPIFGEYYSFTGVPVMLKRFIFFFEFHRQCIPKNFGTIHLLIKVSHLPVVDNKEMISIFQDNSLRQIKKTPVLISDYLKVLSF